MFANTSKFILFWILFQPFKDCIDRVTGEKSIKLTVSITENTGDVQPLKLKHVLDSDDESFVQLIND